MIAMLKKFSCKENPLITNNFLCLVVNYPKSTKGPFTLKIY